MTVAAVVPEPQSRVAIREAAVEGRRRLGEEVRRRRERHGWGRSTVCSVVLQSYHVEVEEHHVRHVEEGKAVDVLVMSLIAQAVGIKLPNILSILGVK